MNSKILQKSRLVKISKTQENLESAKSMIPIDMGDSFVNNTEVFDKGIDIAFKDISYSVQIPNQDQYNLPCFRKYNQKIILNNVSGIFKSGTCTAIMGSSGAGKTTLLNIISCRIKPNKGGKIFANNIEYNYDSFGKFANYVMQKDLLLQTLTVRQTLNFAAELKINSNQIQREKRLNQLINQFKLQKCLDTLVGGVLIKGISGGQKKRVCIAYELISDPQVIVLDEPTSGLDSLTSFIIVRYLKKLANQRKKNVIMTIHQPNSDIFQLFDDLLLLVEGKLIYQSKASLVTDYFQTNFKLTCPMFINKPDFIMSKIDNGNQQNRKFYGNYYLTYQSSQKTRIQGLIENRNSSDFKFRTIQIGFFQTLFALVKRHFINILRNPILVKAKIIQAVALALFFGFLFINIGRKDYTDSVIWSSITGCLFFIVIGGVMFFLTPNAVTFSVEREVFYKQSNSKMYNIFQYLLSRNLVEIPQIIILPLVMIGIYYFIIGLSATLHQFLVHYITAILIGISGSSLGLLIGVLAKDSRTIGPTSALIHLPMLLFASFFKNRGDFPAWIGWIQYISPFNYGFIALMQNEIQHKQSYINNLRFNLSRNEAMGMLLILFMGFQLLSFFVLWFKKGKLQ